MDLTKNNSRLRKEIIRIVLPITFQNLISAAVNTADVVMLGMLSQTALSASSLANQIVSILFMFFSGMSSGIIIMAAQYWGRKQPDAIEKLFGMGLKVSLLVSAGFTLMALLIPQYLMLIYTSDPELIRTGAGYLRIVGWSYLFMGFSQIYECVIKSMDRARTATCFSAAALAANILLNAILIFGLLGFPALGMTGAAIATVIARGIEMALCMADAARQKDIHVGPAVLLIWNKVLFKDFRRYSMPALGNEFLWGAGFSCYTIVLGHMGSDIVAANSVVSAARNLCTVFVFGAAYGTAIIVGNDIGKGSEETARKDAAAMLRVVFWAALLSGLILVLLRPLILHFTTLSSTAEYDLGIMLWINCIYILGMAMNTVYICGIFRAGGDSRYGFILDTIAMWCIFVPLGFISAFLLHLPALVVYTITCSDEFFKLPINMLHYRKGTWIRNITRSEAELK